MPKFKSGSRQLERLLKTHQLDKRTRTARDKTELLDAIGADAGGWANLTARERIVAEVGVDALLIARAIVNHAFTNGLFEQGADGMQLTPAVAKGFATYQGVATRALVALNLRPDKVAR